MAVLTTFKLAGDPDELLRLKNEKVDPVAREEAVANGAIEHIVVKTGEGLTIFNLFESAEGPDRAAEKIGPVAQEAGMPPPSDWQVFEIVQRETPGG